MGAHEASSQTDEWYTPAWIFEAMGVSFDLDVAAPSGCDGRDWEWDWSLSGPVSVTFRSRAKKPERRT